MDATCKRTRRAVLALAVLAGISRPAFAEMPPREARRIERLIAAVANSRSARFVRNGKEFDAPDAGRFLRGKLEKLGQDVASAEQFIATVASRSSTTGLIYQVRLADGATMPSERFLMAELQRIDQQ